MKEEPEWPDVIGSGQGTGEKVTMESLYQFATKDAQQLARKFHEIYERLAPSFGYETRADTREFDPTTPNGRLMVAVCAEILRWQNMTDTEQVCAQLDEEAHRTKAEDTPA